MSASVPGPEGSLDRSDPTWERVRGVPGRGKVQGPGHERRVCGKVGPRPRKEPASPEDPYEAHGLPELRK